MKRCLTAFFAVLLICGLLPRSVYAVCSAPNNWTGLCDSGGSCANNAGLCCTTASECTTVDPATINAVTHDTTGTGVGSGGISSPTQTKVVHKKVCEFAGSRAAECNGCMGSGDAVWTALGCVQFTSSGGSQLFQRMLEFGIGIAGGVALILIIFGGFQLMTAAGNPEKMNAAKELVTSAIAGLLMIIFSVFLLKLIGVDILAIPGIQ